MLHNMEMRPDLYNELIFDPEPWVKGLPASIDAFFVPSLSEWAGVEQATRAHKLFQQQYQVNNVPLLTYSRWDPEGPFLVRA